jgi:hypothetical protein
MKIWMATVLALLIITGCSMENGMSGDKPPKATIEIGKKSYQIILGTYCWKETCADTAGPVELLEGKTPVVVTPNEEVRFVMDYQPLPNEIHLTQWNNGKEVEVTVKDNRFITPAEKGIYYYSYGVWWKDEKIENLSHGDAFYAFVLEVK